MTLLTAVAMAGPGAVEMWVAGTVGGSSDLAGGVLQVVIGLGLLLAFRRMATKIRVTYDDCDVSITWLHGSRETRTERLRRSDVIDVAIDDTPASGGSSYRLVLGTRLGDLAFSDGSTSALAHYEEAANALHRALDIPIRR